MLTSDRSYVAARGLVLLCFISLQAETLAQPLAQRQV